MICYPAVVVHGLPQALAALAPGRPVALLSGPDAGVYGGCGWWRALVDAARAVHPATPTGDILDCGEAAGRAMEALRVGQRLLVLAPLPALAAVAAAAAARGAIVLTHRPAALDLGAPNTLRRLADWLG